MTRRREGVGWRVLLVPAVLLAAWALAAAVGWPSARAVPSPRAVGALAVDELVGGRLWRDLLATLARAGVGVALATVFGVLVGTMVGRSERAWRAVEPSVDFMRAIPPLLVFPLLLLGLGYNDRARVAAVVFGTAGTVLIHVAASIARAPRARRDMVALAGLRGLEAFRVLYLWELLPGLLTGVRIALTQGLVIATATEMLLGARTGLGARALQAQLTYRADRLWLVILLAGLVGFALSGAVAAVERRVNTARADH